jgi:hypothetical protein
MTLLECVTALALLAAGLAITAEVLATCAQHRRDSEQLLAVQLEAANVAEQIAVIPYEELTPTTLQKLQLSPAFQARMPAAELRISSIDSPAGDPLHKRVKIEIRWPGDEEMPRTVSLLTWKYAPLSEATP